MEPEDGVPAANSCAVRGIDGNGSSTVRADEAPGGAWTNVAAMVINFAAIATPATCLVIATADRKVSIDTIL